MTEEQKKLLDKIENGEGFFHHNEYHLENIGEDYVELKANLNPNSMNPYGFAHGGLIFGLGDTAMGFLANLHGGASVTLNANISYLKKGVGEYLLARAEMVQCGRSVCFLKANIYNDKNDLIAVMESAYHFVKKEGIR